MSSALPLPSRTIPARADCLRGHFGSQLLEFHRHSDLRGRHGFGSDTEHRDQRDYRGTARNDGDHRVGRRLRLLGGILLHLPAKVDFGHAERRHQRNRDPGRDAEPGHHGDRHQRPADHRPDARLPVDQSAGHHGRHDRSGVVPSFPGAASVYAICQPSTCNPSPINQVGLFGTGLSISSNAGRTSPRPGTASSYVWFSAPGQSQYFVPIDLVSGTRSVQRCGCRMFRIRW